MTENSPDGQLSRVLAEWTLAKLPARYARAADARDLDTLVELFVPDVNCGRHGRGRDVLRGLLREQLSAFGKSIHMVCGQVLDTVTESAATGTTYCRAEKQVGNRWIVVALRYQDEFAFHHGDWYFSRRTPQLWYECENSGNPADPAQHVTGAFAPSLPEALPTWREFWSDETGG